MPLGEGGPISASLCLLHDVSLQWGGGFLDFASMLQCISGNLLVLSYPVVHRQEEGEMVSQQLRNQSRIRLYKHSEIGTAANCGSFTVTAWRNNRMSLQLSAISSIASRAVAAFPTNFYLVYFLSSSLSGPLVPPLSYPAAADPNPSSNIFAANDLSISAASVSPLSTIASERNGGRRTAFSAAQ